MGHRTAWTAASDVARTVPAYPRGDGGAELPEAVGREPVHHAGIGIPAVRHGHSSCPPADPSVQDVAKHEGGWARWRFRVWHRNRSVMGGRGECRRRGALSAHWLTIQTEFCQRAKMLDQWYGEEIAIPGIASGSGNEMELQPRIAGISFPAGGQGWKRLCMMCSNRPVRSCRIYVSDPHDVNGRRHIRGGMAGLFQALRFWMGGFRRRCRWHIPGSHQQLCFLG